ncbi:uncharacterized protein PHALS_14115 [Plasmopara halstedii]|uniref:Uncharacterized protein n=1 Tax=Plasmopara halstedii TaxID=4781 RepID=A0A0P1AQZ3_PLAHL|nr:uncharacterized protein PHALS_14115 [Plasmopara halstedii]CEG43826.1 hypothetical protein PHALS_14115 [Plasmopara halstedii]|eukprot:XP_024580195.1 hypothetical protein PHALS_14115 [Plasmopara halstedii]
MPAFQQPTFFGVLSIPSLATDSKHDRKLGFDAQTPQHQQPWPSVLIQSQIDFAMQLNQSHTMFLQIKK